MVKLLTYLFTRLITSCALTELLKTITDVFLKANENNFFLFPTLQANHVCGESSLALMNLFFLQVS